MNTERVKRAVETVLTFLSSGKRLQYLDRSDILFVFGNYRSKPAVEAAELWRLGYAPYVLVTGGYVKPLPTTHANEAAYYAEILIEHGVPDESIIRESTAKNTLENVRFGLQAISKAKVACRSLIAVSRPPLIRRCLATLSRQAPHLNIAGYHYHESDWRYPENTSYERLVGEVERLVHYARKGDVSFTEIPNDVRAACRLLHPRAVL